MDKRFKVGSRVLMFSAVFEVVKYDSEGNLILMNEARVLRQPLQRIEYKYQRHIYPCMDKSRKKYRLEME